MPPWWDWNAVGAMGQWVGAAATFAAVLVALSAERRARRTRLSVSAAMGSTPSGKGAANFVISIVNRSGRPVFLDGISILLPDQRELGSLPDVGATGALRDLERRDCRVPAKTVAQWLKAAGHTRSVRLRFVVRDSSGDEHGCHLLFEPGQFLPKPPITPAPPPPADDPPDQTTEASD